MGICTLRRSWVRVVEVEDDGESFEEKIECLTGEFQEQFVESARLEGETRENLRRMGYGPE